MLFFSSLVTFSNTLSIIFLRILFSLITATESSDGSKSAFVFISRFVNKFFSIKYEIVGKLSMYISAFPYETNLSPSLFDSTNTNSILGNLFFKAS